MMMASSLVVKLVSSAPTAFNSGWALCLRSFNVPSSVSSYSRRCFQSGLVTRSSQLMPPSRVSVVTTSQPQLPVTGSTRVQDLHTSSITSRNWFTPRDDTTFWGRTLKKLGFTEIPKSILKASGCLMYMKVADEIDYLKFFEHCNLPDTYASWFTVVELHVWLLSARLMQDGKEGRITRNSLIGAMWEDNEQKSKKLEGALPAARRREIQLLNQQFIAAMMAYDEGLLGNDHVLAGALWKRMLHFDTDPTALRQEHFDTYEKHDKLADKVKALEMLVIYVRSHFVMLNQLSREQLLRKRAFKFAPFDDTLFDVVAKMEKSQISGASSATRMVDMR